MSVGSVKIKLVELEGSCILKLENLVNAKMWRYDLLHFTFSCGKMNKFYIYINIDDFFYGS